MLIPCFERGTPVYWHAYMSLNKQQTIISTIQDGWDTAMQSVEAFLNTPGNQTPKALNALSDSECKTEAKKAILMASKLIRIGTQIANEAKEILY